MILQLGFMSGSDLAKWFGIKYKTYTDSRLLYLAKLESFAKFNIVRGGVNIEEVYIEEYVKNLTDDVKVYLEEVKKAPDHLASITGISKSLYGQPGFEGISIRTIEGRMAKAGKQAFGITAEEDSYGIYGSREYVWAIKLYDKVNHYRFLTPEEDQIFTELLQNLFMDEPERVKKMFLLEEAFRHSKDMTKEEYFAQKEALNLNVFKDVIAQFRERTGEQLVHATAHEIDMAYRDSAF